MTNIDFLFQLIEGFLGIAFLGEINWIGVSKVIVKEWGRKRVVNPSLLNQSTTQQYVHEIITREQLSTIFPGATITFTQGLS